MTEKELEALRYRLAQAEAQHFARQLELTRQLEALSIQQRLAALESR